MKPRWSFGVALASTLATWGCGPRIVTVTFPDRDGTSEYWVCDRHGEKCHGQKDGEVKPTDYEPGLSATAPPKECANGAARMEIVMKGNDIVEIGYECAQPNAPTGGTTGLPPSVPTATTPSAPIPATPEATPTGPAPAAPAPAGAQP